MPLTSNNHVRTWLFPIEKVHHNLDLCLNNNEKHLPDIIFSFIHPKHSLCVRFCYICDCLDICDEWTNTCNICSHKHKPIKEFKNRIWMCNKFPGKLHSYFERLTTFQ